MSSFEDRGRNRNSSTPSLDKEKLPRAKDANGGFSSIFELVSPRGIASLDLLHDIGVGSGKKMGPGSYGLHVKYFQKALNDWIRVDLKARGPLVPENGRFEYPTYKGVCRLQEIEKVPITKAMRGCVGRNTIAALKDPMFAKLVGVDAGAPKQNPKLARYGNELDVYRFSLPKILGKEGGLVDHKDDRGKRTNLGVTAATLVSMKTASLPSGTKLPTKVDDLTADSARSVYRNHWENAGCPYLPPGLATMHFDAAINSGPVIARRMLESSLAACGFQSDFGVAQKLSLSEELQVIKKYSEIRGHHFDGLVRYGKNQDSFKNGWENRLVEVTGFSIETARTYR